MESQNEFCLMLEEHSEREQTHSKKTLAFVEVFSLLDKVLSNCTDFGHRYIAIRTTKYPVLKKKRTKMEFCITIVSHDFPRAFQVMYAILCAILSLITVFSNILLIYTLHETGQFKTISNKLILILSISDLGLGIFVFPLKLLSTQWKRGEVVLSGPSEHISY